MRKRRVPYQRMIRALVDTYVARQAGYHLSPRAGRGRRASKMRAGRGGLAVRLNFVALHCVGAPSPDLLRAVALANRPLPARRGEEQAVRRVPYQRMIRAVVDSYVARQGGGRAK